MADRLDAGAMVGRTSLAAVRRRALLPRRLLIAATGLLCLVGVKAVVRGTPEPVVRVAGRTGDSAGTATAGFAEAFARAYLTWDSRRPELHAVALRPFLGPDVDVDAGLPVPLVGAQRVTWTATIDSADMAAGRTDVTVAVALAGRTELRFVTVPVAHRPPGYLAVPDYPALVGRPPRAPALRGSGGAEVRDAALRAVVRRALGNYLAGAADNLRADLLPGTRVPSSPVRLHLEEIERVELLGSGRVAAVVLARDVDDVAYTLRYELAVARRDRWYVAAINPPTPRAKEGLTMPTPPRCPAALAAAAVLLAAALALFAYADAYAAADVQNAGKNIADTLKVWSGSLFGGVTGIMAIFYLTARRVGPALGFFALAMLVGGFVFAPASMGELSQGLVDTVLK